MSSFASIVNNDRNLKNTDVVEVIPTKSKTNKHLGDGAYF